MENLKRDNYNITDLKFAVEKLKVLYSNAENLKESIATIMFSNMEINKKRIEIRKLKRKGLKDVFVRMFIKLLEYVSEI